MRALNRHVLAASAALLALVAMPAFADGDNREQRRCQSLYENEQARIREVELAAAQKACKAEDPAAAVDEESDDLIQDATRKIAQIHGLYVKQLQKVADLCDPDFAFIAFSEAEHFYDPGTVRAEVAALTADCSIGDD
jgi:hypothetical protein